MFLRKLFMYVCNHPLVRHKPSRVNPWSVTSALIAQTSRYENIQQLSSSTKPSQISSSNSNAYKIPLSNQKGQIEELFESTYHQMIKDLFVDQTQCSSLIEVKNWLQKSIEYNLRNGKRNRAKSLVLAYELLRPNVDNKQLRDACFLGWCVELLQAYFLVLDDIMDNSITRRGQLCWYRKENVGFTAINDAVMFNNSIFYLMQVHLSSHPNYIKMVDLMNEITRFTAYGQCLDLISNPLNKKPDLSTFTDDRYDSIIQYKTAYYSFSLPIRLAMYLSNINDIKLHLCAETILLQIGHLFQVQDDYLDCFGDPNTTGKIGTDIEDGKCSWLVVNALKLANDEQKEEIVQNYGDKSPSSVSKIKLIYEQLDMENYFHNYETSKYKQICSQIDDIDHESLPKEIFFKFLTMIYQRKK